MKELTNKDIQYIYDYSKSKLDICKKLDIRINQNGVKIDNDILEYFSLIGITQRDQISKINLSKHWEEIQKRDYELNPNYCAYCGKKLPFEKRFLKCCNQSCANSYSNKLRGHKTEETKNKISKGVKKSFLTGKYIPKNQYTRKNSEFYYQNIQNKTKNNNKIKSYNININTNKLNNKFKHINELINEGIILNIDNYIPKDKYININNLHIHNCLNCGKEFYGRISKYGNCISAKECCYKCKLEYNSKQSTILRRKEIEAGTFQGWKSRNITSYAEKFWIEVLKNNNIQYIREKLVDYGNLGSGKRYFLDFYIEIGDRKIDLEIDGKQHKYKDRQESDIKRDKFLISKGYEVYRIDWNSINSDKGKQLMKEKIDKFLEFIK